MGQALRNKRAVCGFVQSSLPPFQLFSPIQSLCHMVPSDIVQVQVSSLGPSILRVPEDGLPCPLISPYKELLLRNSYS